MAETGLFGLRQPNAAPRGGGVRGFFRRFGTGAARAVIPDNALQGAAALVGGPAALPGRALFGGLRDAITGIGDGPSGAPLPGWMQQGAPMPPSAPPPQWNLPEWGTGQQQYNDAVNSGPPAYMAGNTPMPAIGPTPQPGRQSQTGLDRSDTIAEGAAAQAMAQGFNDASFNSLQQARTRLLRPSMQ